MEDASVQIFKVLLFLTISVQLSLAETHSLQYLYTFITAGTHFPNFTAVGLVDGEQFMYYDSNISKAVPKTEWINTCKAFTPDFWTTETQKHQNEQRDCQNLMTALMQRPNKPDGDHTLQVIHSCTLNDDMSTLESKFGYDGENVQNADNWLTEGYSVEANAVSLNNDNCIDQLNNFVFSCSEALERKVRPTASVFQKNTSSPQVVCHATGFFPKDLICSWQKDGTDVHEDVELSETLPNEDGTFQKRSILKVSAEELQKHTYKCVIQHSSLEKEMVLKVPKGLGSAGAVNAVYLVVFAALVLFCGYFIWVKKSMGTRWRCYD